MSRYHSYLNSAKEILQQYKGEEPFASFLKKYFAQHKKYGSKDRKQVSHLCYCYFRLGKAVLEMPFEQRILLGLFLCSTEPNNLLNQLMPERSGQVALSVEEKCSVFNAQCSIANVFPWQDELSEGIEYNRFNGSFFMQPDLFLRLRPGKEDVVKKKLEQKEIEYRTIGDECVVLPNSARLDEVIELNREAVVQDYNSQKVGEFLLPVRRGRQTDGAIKLWDCCAASGGKSIMAKDILGVIDLTVTDIRESSLNNLKKRFNEAGIKNYKSFVADLTTNVKLQVPGFNLIICDAPCTGSGTWSRTPEQLFYFDKNEIDKYSSLQKKIVSNTISHLKPGGYFLYITCSVFKKENEDVVDFIKKDFGFDLIRIEVLKGYDKKADTMFAALFRKPS